MSKRRTVQTLVQVQTSEADAGKYYRPVITAELRVAYPPRTQLADVLAAVSEAYEKSVADTTSDKNTWMAGALKNLFDDYRSGSRDDDSVVASLVDFPWPPQQEPREDQDAAELPWDPWTIVVGALDAGVITPELYDRALSQLDDRRTA